MAYIVKSSLEIGKKANSIKAFNEDEIEKLIKEKEAFLAEKEELSKVNDELVKENEELKNKLAAQEAEKEEAGKTAKEK